VLLPASAGIGALLVLVADAIGRGIHPPVEIPAGMITALIGAPYFVYLLARSL
jgi:iron complex transport system permease protein